MSTYGTVVIADVPDEDAAQRLFDQFREVLGRTFTGRTNLPFPMRNPLDDTEIEVEAGDSSVRVTLLVNGAVAAGKAAEVFTGVGAGRAVMCEDGDEWGVTVSGWRLTDGDAECVYRAYLPAEDGAVDDQAAGHVVTGRTAATRLAELFDVEPDPVRTLDADPTPIKVGIGYIADPFLPWLHNLDLDWPEF
ncbi:hypothetical protein ACLQ3C_18115 [Gordonia sp. DT30]|uniref:hypothetical protein n=1 Tax=unclassified Gordonia (in: high G+C Gram-positive bacteria) TaxID=2657482 RepID=UPI003CEAFF46